MAKFAFSPARLAFATFLTGMVALPLAPAMAASSGSIAEMGKVSPAGPGRDPAGRRKPGDDRAGTGEDCVGRYQAALRRIKETEFAALAGSKRPSSSARAETGPAGDLSLPGMTIFTPKPASRSRAEMAALAAASSLAKSRGRPIPSADARWVAERLRTDLSDYLSQKPTPYLCNGVPQYVMTLRKFATRAGNDPARLQSLLATQSNAALNSIDAAFAAMKPVAAPRFAPVDRPSALLDQAPTGAIPGLRPSAGLSRADTTPNPGAGTGASDPDLPPLKASIPRVLAESDDRAAAVDDLLSAARSAGFLAPVADESLPAVTEPAPTEPVLSRLFAARAALRAPSPTPGGDGIRLALASAFADIEALDYLQRAAGEKGDPQSRAADAVFDAILAAQQKECTCGG
ncbi:hypothetical protein Sa4125_10900 [Aureimonas sp. SA4125]|uniref:hypothetical protein n=1 Tax=Aureimonas sp. SA4125 TaxID=2826993 RepID=UPI001CC4EF16|nr:hypothetical protein [Aureimonas sp. SA4125]BDA83548.1 hypothetical protein Sa4125_10900 [Aureimonas sp. SA4125]